jgi:hypothetical protein
MDANRGRAELGVAVTGNVISDSVAEFRQEKMTAPVETGKAARRRRKKEKLRAAQSPSEPERNLAEPQRDAAPECSPAVKRTCIVTCPYYKEEDEEVELEHERRELLRLAVSTASSSSFAADAAWDFDAPKNYYDLRRQSTASERDMIDQYFADRPPDLLLEHLRSRPDAGPSVSLPAPSIVVNGNLNLDAA